MNMKKIIPADIKKNGDLIKFIVLHTKCIMAKFKDIPPNATILYSDNDCVIIHVDRDKA